MVIEINANVYFLQIYKLKLIFQNKPSVGGINFQEKEFVIILDVYKNIVKQYTSIRC